MRAFSAALIAGALALSACADTAAHNGGANYTGATLTTGTALTSRPSVAGAGAPRATAYTAPAGSTAARVAAAGLPTNPRAFMIECAAAAFAEAYRVDPYSQPSLRNHPANQDASVWLMLTQQNGVRDEEVFARSRVLRASGRAQRTYHACQSIVEA